MRLVVAAGGSVALAVVCLLVLVPGRGSASGTNGAVIACPMSHVRYTAYPGVEQGLGNVPWIATAPGGRFKAHLFFYDATMFSWARQHLVGARIFTTEKRRRINPKVLWTTDAKGYASRITIRGRRLDASGSFVESYPGFGQYPSYVKIPTSGCWRVTVTSGRVSGRVVFAAVD